MLHVKSIYSIDLSTLRKLVTRRSDLRSWVHGDYLEKREARKNFGEKSKTKKREKKTKGLDQGGI